MKKVRIINRSFKGGPLFYEGNHIIQGIPKHILRNMGLDNKINQGGPLQPKFEKEMYDKIKSYCKEHNLILQEDRLLY